MWSRPPLNMKLELIKAFSRRSRAVAAKKCTKKRDARAKLLSVPVHVAVVVAPALKRRFIRMVTPKDPEHRLKS